MARSKPCQRPICGHIKSFHKQRADGDMGRCFYPGFLANVPECRCPAYKGADPPLPRQDYEVKGIVSATSPADAARRAIRGLFKDSSIWVKEINENKTG